LRRTVDISLTGVFGAIVAFSYLVPIGAAIGGASIFSLSWVVDTITGILLGPYWGGGAGLIGGIVGNFFKPSPILPLAIFFPALAAVEAGLIVWNLWPLAAVLLISLIVVWFALPTGQVAWPAALFHLLGVAIIITLGMILPKVIRQGSRIHLFAGWMLVAYCGDITRHMLGNILYVTVLSTPAAIFLAAIPYTVVEQTMYALFSAIVGVPLLFAIRSANLDIPLMRLAKTGQLVQK
jgi:hypothetical protein